jgi:Aromatic-ring-opening dioxygenase LigAB, LigA subunit
MVNWRMLLQEGGSMSLHYRFPPAQAYQLNKCLFALKSDHGFCQRYATDAEQALQEFHLTLEERDAVRRGDQERLVALGAHPYLAFMARLRLEMQPGKKPYTYS